MQIKNRTGKQKLCNSPKSSLCTGKVVPMVNKVKLYVYGAVADLRLRQKKGVINNLFFFLLFFSFTAGGGRVFKYPLSPCKPSAA